LKKVAGVPVSARRRDLHVMGLGALSFEADIRYHNIALVQIVGGNSCGIMILHGLLFLR